MCGIVAMIGVNGTPAERSVIDPMTASLVHRGPDEGGVYLSGSVGLGFRRLAILDLSAAARQPMVSEDEQLVLVFNGEIFNYVELRDELRSLGHTFKSTGDTEVLLKAYREWGQECLHRFNGMWAFLIYDRRFGTLFGARDRFGVKPLYFYHHTKYLLFASEIKAIRVSGLYRGGPNWRTISRFLLQDRLDERSESFYTEINQILPGTAFEVDLQGQLRRWRYWRLSNISGSDVNDPAATFAALFEDSMRLRMRSDVAVGVSLSGGLDSTSIMCAAARLKAVSENGHGGHLMAFSYNPSEFDESAYIADTLKQTHAQLMQLHSTPVQLWENLARVLWFHDEPVHSMTALVGFELMKLAKSNGIRVVLSGQGADETIAGYFSYFVDYWHTLLKNVGLRETWREIGAYAQVHGGDRWKLFLGEFRRLLQPELRRVAGYCRLVEWKHQRRDRLNPWFNPELSKHLPSEEVGKVDQTLDARLMRSVEFTPLPLYLRIEDRNSMAHSVEVRLPFLDYRLVSLAFRLPANWKTRGPWNKYVLREAMRNRIPESVRSRIDKMGFPVPVKAWLADVLYEPVQDLLSSQEVRERGLFQVDTIRKDLDLHRQGKIDISRNLFNLVQFEIWSQLEKIHPSLP